jgi:hypothetical protein
MREQLPNRHEIETFKFQHGGIKHHCSMSRYSDGRLAEVFIDCGKVNSGVQNVMRDGAILISLALQFGTPVETLRHAMTRDDKGEPSSPLGKLLDMVTQFNTQGLIP